MPLPPPRKPLPPPEDRPDQKKPVYESRLPEAQPGRTRIPQPVLMAIFVLGLIVLVIWMLSESDSVTVKDSQISAIRQWAQMGPLIRLYHLNTPTRVLASDDHGHYPVLRALAAHDPDAARAAIQDDIGVGSVMVDWLEEQGAV